MTPNWIWTPNSQTYFIHIWYLPPEAQILVSFALCLDAYASEIQGHQKLGMHQMATNWTWTLNSQTYVTGRVSSICCGITRHNFKLARSLFFIKQLGTPLVQPQPAGPSWAAQHSRIHRPSRSSVVETPPYLDHRQRPAIYVTPHAQPHFCACSPTSRTCPPRHIP